MPDDNYSHSWDYNGLHGLEGRKVFIDYFISLQNQDILFLSISKCWLVGREFFYCSNTSVLFTGFPCLFILCIFASKLINFEDIL